MEAHWRRVPMKLLFSDELARCLEISEAAVLEMARTQKLPFGVSSASPRRLFVDAQDLNQWRAAAKTCCED
jgi:hypothetical protein